MYQQLIASTELTLSNIPIPQKTTDGTKLAIHNVNCNILIRWRGENVAVKIFSSRDEKSWFRWEDERWWQNIHWCGGWFVMPVRGLVLKHMPNHVLKHVPSYVVKYVPDRHVPEYMHSDWQSRDCVVCYACVPRCHIKAPTGRRKVEKTQVSQMEVIPMQNWTKTQEMMPTMPSPSPNITSDAY